MPWHVLSYRGDYGGHEKPCFQAWHLGIEKIIMPTFETDSLNKAMLCYDVVKPSFLCKGS